jgi:ribosomal protein L12E/L44/L45/RPP1/RPP2
MKTESSQKPRGAISAPHNRRNKNMEKIMPEIEIDVEFENWVREIAEDIAEKEMDEILESLGF